MIDRQIEHDAMIRRVEQARKALSSSTTGRSRVAGITRALDTVLDEAHERMEMAWGVLNEAYFEGAKHYTYRAQKAAELGLCYTTIMDTYDELCRVGVISRDEQTEPTTSDMARATKEEERAAKQRRRRAGL